MNRLKKYGIKNEQDFIKALEVIDQEMKDSNIPIPARQIQGWIRFSRKFTLNLSWPDPLTSKVMNWFTERYGSKLNIRLNDIDTVVAIRGDFFIMTIPKVFGSFRIICDPNTIGIYTNMQIAKDKKDPLPIINILDCIKDLTSSYATDFKLEEMELLTNTFIMAFLAISHINEVKNIDFIEEAKADIKESVNHLVAHSPQYGASKWSSLQAAEKFLKSYIKIKLGNLPKRSNHHNLEKLAEKTKNLGLQLSSHDELSKIQCTANVRYESNLVTPINALNAHYAAIKVCGEIATYFIPPEQRLRLNFNWKSENVLKAGRFYQDPQSKANYFCKKIDNNIAHLFLVESYLNGNLF